MDMVVHLRGQHKNCDRCGSELRLYADSVFCLNVFGTFQSYDLMRSRKRAVSRVNLCTFTSVLNAILFINN
jgi:hypothetical protein